MEAELQAFLDQHADHTLDDGRRAVVRNGHQPERTVQTGIGDVPVQVPKTHDRSGAGLHFTSNLPPPYLRKTRSVEELLPWLYLKGVSTGDFQEALTCLLDERAEGLSASTLGRLKQKWLTEHAEWQARDLSTRRHVYWWADGVHFNLRGEDDDRACLLVIIGVLPDGTKEFVGLDDRLRESEQSRHELLAFYDFPAEHWQSIRTTNPIDSTVATVRLRDEKHDPEPGVQAFKLGQSAQQRWRRLRGYRWLDELERDIILIDGVAQYEDSNDHRSAA